MVRAELGFEDQVQRLMHGADTGVVPAELVSLVDRADSEDLIAYVIDRSHASVGYREAEAATGEPTVPDDVALLYLMDGPKDIEEPDRTIATVFVRRIAQVTFGNQLVIGPNLKSGKDDDHLLNSARMLVQDAYRARGGVSESVPADFTLRTLVRGPLETQLSDPKGYIPELVGEIASRWLIESEEQSSGQ